MPHPVMIDTDMGVDDAVALTMAFCANGLEVVGIATVGGNVAVDQATANVGRCLGALRPPKTPEVGRGLDQADGSLSDATHVFGRDGLGESDLSVPDGWSCQDALVVYEKVLTRYAGSLTIVAIGPLTNLAALLEADPGVVGRVGRVIIMGGAVFCPGNVTQKAEFNIYRDPAAAARVLASGLPITLVPLDVTRKVAIDESNRAHLAASNTRSGQMLAKMIEYPMGQGIDGPGRMLLHDALAVGILLWPELFLQTQMAIKVVTEGPDRGRTVPAVGKKDVRPVSVILSVQAADFIGNLLELLCSEAFVV